MNSSTSTRSLGLAAVRGDLSDLKSGAVAVTETWAFDAGIDVGQRIKLRVDGDLLRPRVVALVPDAPDLYGEVIASRSLAPVLADSAVPGVLFVDPGGADLAEILHGTKGQAIGAGQWLREVDRQTRAANDIGLWVLLGPAALYASIAIINAVLMGVSQRKQQATTLALLGATRSQLRRMVIWENGLIGAAALLTGTAIAASVGWLIRSALKDVPEVGFTIPWLPVTAILATCAALILCAALTAATRQRQNTQ